MSCFDSSSGIGSFLPIIILVAIAAIAIPFFLKRRKNKTANAPISNRKNKDEVWKAVKQFLKDSDDYGKEIIDCYVAKRNSIDFINPNLPKEVKAKKREEIRLRKWEFKQKQKEAAKKGVKLTAPKERDLYVVCFTTRQTKTGVIDKPRAIECEVINRKINKKEYDRQIIINGLLDYDKEMEWIAPLKASEQVKSKKAIKQQEKAEARKQKRLAKAKLKAQQKVEKAKAKEEKNK